jgi:hypothetical protein
MLLHAAGRQTLRSGYPFEMAAVRLERLRPAQNARGARKTNNLKEN